MMNGEYLQGEMMNICTMKWWWFYDIILPHPTLKLIDIPLLFLDSVNFLVASKDIQVKESFATEGACQPHPQVDLSNMCTNGGPWGWRALFAALNPALVNSFSAPTELWEVACGLE